MKFSHVHCRVRDLHAAASWFERVLQVAPVFNNDRMVWLSFGNFGVILDAATDDSIVTIGFDSKDCDADYLSMTREGPGGLMVEIEQLLSHASK